MSFSADVEVPHCSNLVIVTRLCLFLLLVLFPLPSNLHGLGLVHDDPSSYCMSAKAAMLTGVDRIVMPPDRDSSRAVYSHSGQRALRGECSFTVSNADRENPTYTWPSGACFHAASEGLVYSTMPLSWLLSRWFRSTPGMAHLWSNLTWKLC